MALVGAGLGVLIAGSAGAVIVTQVAPSAFSLYVIGMVSLAIHFSAMYLRDVWVGEYEPEQATWTTASQILAVVVILGIQLSGILLLATAISVGGPCLDAHEQVAEAL